ncbi:hypothetical protein [Chryseobacterium sp. JUb7]|uniref:hypothetical protein n=1 Tax=Chryseobacterium sp. JUb7 TaxID=2940599 RepID=UPI002168BE87|nr:hypothetical protein [Chryseobacterium sp. JUb7]MCS3529332.1 hypothetical protein [Chryseobacterium sp. JUb7]
MITNKIFNVDDYYFDIFRSISESLTGFSVNELQSTALTETYYEHISGQIEIATFIEFLKPLDSQYNAGPTFQYPTY